MLNIMYAILGFAGKLIIQTLIMILNILEFILSMIYVLGSKIGVLFIFMFVLMLIVPGTFHDFILSGNWVQIGVKSMLFIAPALLIKVIPKILLELLANFEFYLKTNTI